MLAVLDTNVVVSGLLKPYSSAGYIVRLVADGTLRVAYDARILLEYWEVLARPKFGFDAQEVRHFLTQLEADGTLVTAQPLDASVPDPADVSFLPTLTLPADF